MYRAPTGEKPANTNSRERRPLAAASGLYKGRRNPRTDLKVGHYTRWTAETLSLLLQTNYSMDWMPESMERCVTRAPLMA
jgi:hypothetical protein